MIASDAIGTVHLPDSSDIDNGGVYNNRDTESVYIDVCMCVVGDGCCFYGWCSKGLFMIIYDNSSGEVACYCYCFVLLMKIHLIIKAR